MKEISNKEYGGERPLFGEEGLLLDHVTIHAGESALKNCREIIARHCTFEGKYPFWHCRGFEVDDCYFTEGARAALWYSIGCKMRSCKVEAPKMFRMMADIDVEDTDFPNGQEMLWDCLRVRLRNVQIENCDYLFSHTSDIDIDGYRQQGNYSFQYGVNARICNAVINSKDAFWNTRNFTIVDSEINGEYLGWYSENLTLINCKISGTQPLCYCKNLKLVNCTLAADCDLAFEDSDLQAEIVSPITSVKNPRSGKIQAPAIGEILLDSHLLPMAACEIVTEA